MYRPPDEVGVSQATLLKNVVILDSYAVRTRQGFQKVGSSSFANVSPIGAVQGMFFFNTPSISKILVVEGAKSYTFDGTNWSNPLTYVPSNAIVNVAIMQGLDCMMIADGINLPYYWNGTTFTQFANADDASYTSGDSFLKNISILCWCAGRMVASGNVNHPDTIYCSNLLDYHPKSLGGNANWDSATLSFRIGDGDGEAIVAIAAIQNQTIAVLKENSVWLVNLNSTGTNPVNPIANWTAQAQGDLVGAGVGCVGRDAWCIYQNDLLFMSQDGVQSLQRMQAAAGQYQLTSPLSVPIQPMIDRISWAYASKIKAVKYRELAIFFVPIDGSTYNNYALVWNGRIGQWSGYWTNVNVSSVCVSRFNKIVELHIGDSSGDTGYVNKWNDSKGTINDDVSYLDNDLPILCEIDSRAFNFGNLDANKKLRACLFRFNAGNAVVTVSAVLDLSNEDNWIGSTSNSFGSILGGSDLLGDMATSQFKLKTTSPAEVYHNLEGLPYCNEVLFKTISTNGWFELRNITAVAFMKTLRDPEA